jgi:hypothetical protein
MDIRTVNPKTGMEQWFEIRLPNLTFNRTQVFIEGYSEDKTRIPNLHKLTDELAKVDRASFKDMEFVPLTEEGAEMMQENRLNYHYRGEERYVTANNRIPDGNPFVVRQKPLNFRIVARGGQWGDNPPSVYFQSQSYKEVLTEGQQNTLVEWFGQQIIDVLTPEVIEKVKSEYRQKLIDHAKHGIPAIREWLDMLEKFN